MVSGIVHSAIKGDTFLSSVFGPFNVEALPCTHIKRSVPKL